MTWKHAIFFFTVTASIGIVVALIFHDWSLPKVKHDLTVEVLLEEILAELQKPPPKTKEMRKEFQHFRLRLKDCEYIAYWTYSFDRSLRLIHAADCDNRGGHVFVLSDGSISTFFGRGRRK